MGILTVVSLGVAQLFAASTRVNVMARGQTSTTMLAEQKMEQIRSLTWGFDTNGEGLPVSDTTSDLTVSPTTQSGSGLNPSPTDSLERNTTGFVDFVDAGGAWVGTGSTPPANGCLHPPLVDPAAADEPEQHAGHPGARHANGERDGAPDDFEPACADAWRHAAGDGEDEESIMTGGRSVRARTSAVGGRLFADRAAGLVGHHADGDGRDLHVDESGAGHIGGANRDRRHAAAHARRHPTRSSRSS